MTDIFIEQTILRREKYCDGKVVYSKGRAEEVRRARSKRTTKRLRTYLCNKCHGWHLTHAPRHVKKRIKRHYPQL